MNEVLSKSTAKYKIVFGHYPLYASGNHLTQAKDALSLLKLRELLEPILKEHQVDLYLAGHEHMYERTEPIDGVTHVVSGAAGKVRKKKLLKETDYPRAHVQSTLHFMFFQLADNGLIFEALDDKLKPLEAAPTVLLPKKASGTQLDIVA